MQVLEIPQTLPERIHYLLQPVLLPQAARGSVSEAERTAWQELIDKQLSAWARDPHQLADEGVEAPSPATIQLAIDVASVLCEQSVEAPDRVVPTGDGGIVFRWRCAGFTWTLELDDDGSLETVLMDNSHLVCRHSLHPEPTR
jgi:hypothetical protein